MPKVTVIELDAAARRALQQGYEQGRSPAFRKRCQMILLKSQGRTSSEIGQIVGSCEMSVHNWIHRYQDQGIEGLQAGSRPSGHFARVRFRSGASRRQRASPTIERGPCGVRTNSG